MEGFLWKKGKRFGSYKKRFFAIAGLSISYRESFEPGSKGKGVIDLAKVKYFSSCSDPTKHRKVGWFSSFALDLVTDTRTWTLIPESEADRNLWVDALLKILPQQVISSELRDSSLARARAAAAAAVPVVSPRGGGESDDGGRVQKSPKKPKKMSSSESEEDVVVKPKVNAKGAEVELMKAEAELKRLREQNEAYRAQIDGGGGGGRKQKVPKDDKEVPLLDPNDRSDDEEQGPSCCSRVCTFFRVNFAIIVVIAVNFVLLAFGCVFLALSVWLQKNLKNFAGLLGSNGENSVYLCLGLGGGLALVAILGMVGVCIRRKASGRCMLYVFALTMTLLVIVEITVAALMFTSAGLTDADKEFNKTITSIQQTCCANGSTACSWLPPSILSYCKYPAGFREKVTEFIHSKIKLLAIVSAVVAVIEIASIVCSLMLVCDGKRRGKKKAAKKPVRQAKRSVAKSVGKGKRKVVDSDDEE